MKQITAALYLFVGLTLGLSLSAEATEKVLPQSLFFKHWLHYDSQGIPCSECHTFKNDRTYSLPGHKICEFCHPPGKVDDYAKSQGPTCFKCHPQDNPESTVLLSTVDRSDSRHFYHSEALRDSCTLCHGLMLDDEIAMGVLQTSTEERERIRRKAHRFYRVAKCQRCHIDHNPQSVPNNHALPEWKGKGHSTIAPEFNCRICHTKSYCQGCHEESY